DKGRAVIADNDIVAKRFGVGERKAALGAAGREIECFQPGALDIAWPGDAKAADIIGAHIQGSALLVGEHAERGAAVIGAGFDELFSLSARRDLHDAAIVEASHIERSVLG